MTRWALELGEPYPSRYHDVRRARTADGVPVVLKTGRDLEREGAALAAWGARGAVRLLRRAPGALLLERADPGTPAATLVPDADDDATAAAVEVLRELHTAQPPATGVPALAERLAALDAHLADPGRAGLLPHALVDLAGGLARELLAGAPATVLLHGDLHHDNVLRSGDRWLAIDPHGVVGDPGYDTGAWLYNPLGSDVTAFLERRVEQLADGLGQPLDRIRAWGFVQAVLSAVWTVQDTGRPPADGTLAVAARLRP